MNNANKITITRLIINCVMLIILLLPWSAFNVTWPTYLISSIQIELKYIIVGIIFIINIILDFVDSSLDKGNDKLESILDEFTGKSLVDSLLIIFAYERCIPLLIPIVFILCDILIGICKNATDKEVSYSKFELYKNLFVYIGLALTIFYNLPFELIHLDLQSICLIIATLLCILSTSNYCYKIGLNIKKSNA